ncbi:uncharacterized protein LOC111614268 [Centruroides sculpturatus]|uniref:uncharacterized protein LOC111614268 n=1 Tax=Centruroides sculpturatus TaxID=218467 RepID=UPI000C6D6155|nr:uncharacterized protein LOC111614268 [Centruroides sculpturatus]
MEVTVTPHGSLNTSCGVISEVDLKSEEESDIQIGLSDQGVTAVRRFSIRQDGKLIPTKHLILTFNKPTLPCFITAGYLRCPQFGHSQTSCRGKSLCAQCGVEDHQNTECSTTPCCVNCKDAHPAYSRKCPTWQKEKEIQRTCGVQTDISVSPDESLTRHEKCLLIPSTQTAEKYSKKTKTPKTGVITRNVGSKKAAKNPLNKQKLKAAISKSKRAEAQSMSEFSDEETNNKGTPPTSPPKGKSAHLELPEILEKRLASLAKKEDVMQNSNLERILATQKALFERLDKIENNTRRFITVEEFSEAQKTTLDRLKEIQDETSRFASPEGFIDTQKVVLEKLDKIEDKTFQYISS